VMPGPFLSTVLLGGSAVLEGGDDAQKERYLKAISAGELKSTLALLEPNGRFDASGVEATAGAGSGGDLLNRGKLFVPDAHVADLVIVATRTERSTGEEGISLFAIDVPKGGVTVTPLRTMDQTRKLCEVKLDQVRVGPEALIGARGGGWPILKRVTD